MQGPKPLGFWSKDNAKSLQSLSVGQKYVVAKSFTDADGQKHPAGESWIYAGHELAPQSLAYNLFVQKDGTEWTIPVSMQSPDQKEVLDNLTIYFSKTKY